MLRKIVNGIAPRRRGGNPAKTLMNTGVQRSWIRGHRLLMIGIALCALSMLSVRSLAVTDPSQDFAIAEPGYHYRFPTDHGAHDRFRTEWWYYTGQITTAAGRPFGFQLTFFRRGIPPSQVRTLPSEWSIQHLYLAHFALTDLAQQRFYTAEKVSRAGLGKAGATSGHLHVWIDRWSASGESADGTSQHLQAATTDFAIDLTVTPQKPPVVHGEGGVSLKGAAAGQASHYYSLSRLATKGRITIAGDSFDVTGLSWMDHEFGSADLGSDVVGWDWFSLHLSDATELMWYRLRHADATADPASSGTLILADGQSHPLTAQDVTVESLSHWTSPRSGARYPQRWRLTAPSIGLDVEVTALLSDQELQTPHSTHVTYWEGAVAATGRSRGAAISGRGYVELTGYAERLGQKL